MDRKFSVLSYGAKGDGIAKDTKAIQEAINTCSKAGGGVIYFPPGIYHSGTIYLKDNITIHLEAGATLFSSIDKEDFIFAKAPENIPLKPTRCGFIYGKGVSNVTITGRGNIVGRDKYFWTPKGKMEESWKSTPIKYWAKEWRPMSLLFEDCHNIIIEGIIIKESPVYSGWFIDCKYININNITVLNDIYGPNTDGFHFCSCKFVHISNSHFLTGDDSIAVDGNGLQDSDTFTITNCTFDSSVNVLRVYTGLDPGMAVEDSKDAVVRNISMSNCSIYNASGVINITSENGLIENLTFSNISMTLKQEGTPIFLMTDVGKLRGILFQNMNARANGACTIIGTAESYVEDVTLDNARFFIEPKKKLYELDIPDPIPSYAHHHFAPFNIYLRYIKGIKLSNVGMKWAQPESDNWGSAIKCRYVEDIELAGFTGKHAGSQGNYPTIIFDNIRKAFIHGCRAPEGTVNYLELSGETTSDINMVSNDLSKSECPVKVKDNIKDELVRWAELFNSRAK